MSDYLSIIRQTLDEELREEPCILEEFYEFLDRVVEDRKTGSGVLARLVNNFPTVIPGGSRWDSYDEPDNTIRKNGRMVSWTEEYKPDALQIMESLGLTLEHGDYRKRYAKEESVRFSARLLDLRMFCRLLCLGYDGDELYI